MCCTATQVSPFTLKGKMFFAVHFDDDTFVSNVTFENCVLINVSFRGCMLSDVRFINVHLEEAEFVACDFNNFTWLSASESERTWQGETFESYLMGDEIPEQISDPQWTVRKMEEQTIPDRTGDPGPQWIADRDAAQTDTDEVPHGLPTQTYNYHVFIDEQAPHVANSHDQSFGTVQNQYCGPNGYDFSGLGNMVRPAYANGVEKSRVETIISEWHDFADQMEAERQRERDQKALQEARVKSAEEAATDAAHIRSPQRGVPDFVSCSSSASMDMSGSETQQSSPDPPQASRVSTTDFRSSLQNTGWNAQASQLPPHLHETFTAAGSDGQAEGLQDGCGDDDDDDDDGPVYRPAARLRR